MVEDITANPEDVALLCRGSIAPETEDLAHLIEQFLRWFGVSHFQFAKGVAV